MSDENKGSRLKKFWMEWVRPLMVVILITSAFRSAIADWYIVPTGSMKPTIMEGDRVFVNKVAYDLKVPFTTVRLSMWDDPARGDIVVLYSPYDGKRLVKRVIGIPGDWIEMRDSKLYVNEKAVAYEPLAKEVVNEIPVDRQPDYSFFAENLFGVRHPVMITPFKPSVRDFQSQQVPPEHYFVMGDNRDDSFDSRMFGLVSRSSVVGRATAVVLSLNPEKNYLPRWHRFFTRLP
jgi:signal peptidase I